MFKRPIQTIIHSRNNCASSQRRPLQLSPIISWRREIYRNKFLITLSSILLIIIYLLSFGYEYDFYDRCIYSKDSFRRQKCMNELENIYKNQLGVIDELFVNKTAQCSGQWIITAFPGRTINALVWEYLSLIALRRSSLNVLHPYLSWQSKMELEQIFDNIDLPTITEIHPMCYNLQTAQILSSTTGINIDDSASKIDRILVLRQNAKRYLEIFDGGSNLVKYNLQFTSDYIDLADRELALTHIRLGSLERTKPIVGIFIDQIMLPKEYFQRAMNFHRNLHKNVLFLIICTSNRLNDCYQLFEQHDNDTRIIQSLPERAADLSVLSYCNHTIIASDFGIIPALFNDGVTVVYDSQNNNNKNNNNNNVISRFMMDNLSNWYAIS